MGLKKVTVKKVLRCYIVCLAFPIGLGFADSQQNPPVTSNQFVTRNVKSCSVPPRSFSNLPQEVIIGTDVFPITNFEAVVENEKRWAFQAEMGGAVLQLNIEYDSKKQLAVVREYVEPGMPAETKRYAGLCINQGRIYGPGVRGIFVQDGLLWLELNSGNGFIPPDLWIQMQQQEKDNK